MASGNIGLASLVPALDEVARATQEEYPTLVQKPRRILCRFIEQYLTNINVVAHELGENIGSQQCAMLLKFIKHIVQSSPHMFVNPGLPALASTDLGNEMASGSKDFCSWIVLRLLRILASGACSVLHGSVMEAVALLLHVSRLPAVTLFAQLCLDILGLMRDLACILRQQLDSPMDVTPWPVTLVGRFVVVPTDFLQEASLQVDSHSSLELFQISLTKLVLPILPDIAHLLDGHLPELWAVACCQLQMGRPQLKAISMTVLAQLTEMEGPSHEHLKDFLVEMLVGVMEILADRKVEERDEDASVMEEPFMQLMAAIFPSQRESEREQYCPPECLDWLIDKLRDFVSRRPLLQVKSLAVQAALCGVVQHVLCCPPAEYECADRIRRERVVVICAHLIGVLGTFTSQKHFIRCLVMAIMHELGVLSEENVWQDTDHSTEPRSEVLGEEIHGNDQLDSGPARKRPCLDSKQTDNGEVQSGLLHKLQERLGVLLTQLKDKSLPNTLDQLEGVATIVHVIALVCAGVARLVPNVRDPLKEVPRSVVDRMWIPCTEILTQVVQVLMAHLEGLTMGPWTEQSLARVISIIDGLLLMHVHCTMFSTDTLEHLCWVLSLPWVHKRKEKTEVAMKSIQEMTSLGQRLEAAFTPCLRARCLCLLALLPIDISSSWRMVVLQLASESCADEERAAAVWAGPVLLRQLLGLNTASGIVHSVLQERLTDPSDAVQKKLAAAIGPLACVLAGCSSLLCRPFTAALKSTSESAIGDELLCHNFTLGCGGGGGSYGSGNGGAQPKCSGRICLPASTLTPFLLLLQPNTAPEVKLAFIGSLPQLLVHIDMRGGDGNGGSNSDVLDIMDSCLGLMENKDLGVRMSFSLAVRHLIAVLGPEDTAKPSPCSELLISKLKMAYKKAKLARDESLRTTLALTTGQISRVAQGRSVLLCMVLSLVHSVTSKWPLVAATAHGQIRQLASVRGISPQALFSQFKKPICQFLAKSMHDSQQTASSEPLPEEREASPDVLSEVASVFDFPDLTHFLNKTLRYLLTFLVAKATPASATLMGLLAQQLHLGSREALLTNFKYIFSHLVCCCSKTQLEAALLFVQKETEIELGSLLRQDFQSLHNELLLRLGESYRQVFNGLAMLASFSSSEAAQHVCGDISSSQQMAEYLQPRLLGILAFFNLQLLSSGTSMEDKKKTLNSLMSLMELMGSKHVTSVRVKMMTTLRTGLRYQDDFPRLCCKAWDCFVRCLELTCLGPLLSQITVALLPLMTREPKNVACIFHYMIVENRNAVQDYLHEVYFMPDHPDLGPILDVLNAYSKEQSRSADLVAELQRLMRSVQHENLQIRIHALSRLRHTLYQNQGKLMKYAWESETVEPVISHLVTVLLEGCHDADLSARLLFGECLGELGAIDPGRLDLSASCQPNRTTTFLATVEEPEFARELLTELTRAFLATADNVRAQDCAAYAMQELLQIYDCKEGTESTPGRCLWRSFPDNVQEILEPHLHTRYINSSPMFNWAKLRKPIYVTNVRKTFQDWACTWAGYLLTKVRQEPARRVFTSCSMIIKHDIKVTLFLLPHILVYVLLDADVSEEQEVFDEMLAVLQYDVGQEGSERADASDLSQMSAQTIFSVLDHLTLWSRHKLKSLKTPHGVKSKSKAGTKSSAVVTNSLGNEQYQRVQSFLKRIPQSVLSSSSFRCKAYTRSLMHFEAHIGESKQDIQKHLAFLQTLYVAMDEPDGVAGVTALRKEEPSLHEQTLEHESIGQLRDATACYEKAIQGEPHKISYRHGLLRSLLGLGELSTAYSMVNGILSQRPEWTNELNVYRVEAAWKLTQWGDLETCLTNETYGSWSIGLGKLLLAAKQCDRVTLERQLKVVRAEQMVPLSAASLERGSYQRGYEYIIRLHMLSELEHSVSRLSAGENLENRSVWSSAWQARLEVTQNSFRAKEPILELRRALLCLAGDSDALVGECWLQSARVARKAGHYQTAYNALLNARAVHPPDLCVERARWLWIQGKVHQALLQLQRSVEQHVGGEGCRPSDPRQTAVLARAFLLIGRLMEETANFESNAIVKQYKEVTSLLPDWEDGHFYLAKYYDKLMPTMTDNRMEKQGDIIYRIVYHFGRSLMFGNQFIYQSMPRLLSLWLDFGAKVFELERGNRSERQHLPVAADLAKIIKIMTEHTQKLAPYQFLTAFSQLISRICHPHAAVCAALQAIIVKVLTRYPQQALWMMMAVSKSSHAARAERCKAIFGKAVQVDGSLRKFIRDGTSLTDLLLELCNKPTMDKQTTMSMNVNFRGLKRLVDDTNFSNVLIPLQAVMTPTLPSTPGGHADHDPFPGNMAYIVGFHDPVEVLSSLQKPKKICIRGSDGRSYPMMCKPKDDLRKDCRLMEFNSLINKCLRKDAESRRRDLRICTYAVIPLNEECGLVEWVNNTESLRTIVDILYNEKGIGLTMSEVSKCILPIETPLEQKLSMYRDKLLPPHPPVFHEWFLRTFPDPTSWYSSRLGYTRSTAVMSMVGYVLGLGDRHGENILFDSLTGECMHVDFNCLFNKGLTFGVPELVPFRLTHNMVHAMGPMGLEGLFRRACEVTMRVMCDQRESLISVLKTFIHDPLVEWSRPLHGSWRGSANEAGEVVNEKAKQIVQDIEQRLHGVIKNPNNRVRGLPLSIEGHVHYLIQEATNEKLLCQMYLGWAPFH
ncbi:serine/threonine-protein kinase ATR [Petromyzon marinus]|uniref:Serine/threonine-protein kinase ATR n=1 Tax=Petromyzon marinus TaxID=7757 RepID=A0AAJ7T425_PETMA|nr:serine/threonine-protein kinase ATR isoform X1 [Petromyzon marinus]XP_032809793.1 serine/threonine-protein kinase ATR isoform X1 [Petromyzon marinus]XP_032809794.1 serine/threonine-protein kinase ATR isoform X1 [Petromyzon marinus]XP_032809795.1 serine/threonine-protein kinase ATR isoform X1 [Petromyzon marinus]XP_032809796.1 serine/threonine-protein kinase ATR isoform X1 [Petromyzon marinus]